MAKATKRAVKSETPKAPAKRARKPRATIEVETDTGTTAAKLIDLSRLKVLLKDVPFPYKVGGGALVVLILWLLLSKAFSGQRADDKKVQQLTERNERLKAQLDSISAAKRVADSIAIVALVEADIAHAETQTAITDREITRSEGESVRQKTKIRTDETANKIEHSNLSELDILLDSLMGSRRLKESIKHR